MTRHVVITFNYSLIETILVVEYSSAGTPFELNKLETGGQTPR